MLVFICEICLIDTCDTTHWHVWRDIIGLCHMTHWYVWHDTSSIHQYAYVFRDNSSHKRVIVYKSIHINTLRHTETHCNTLHTLQHTATHCNTLQHTATHCNTLQHTATHCNTLQHSATLCSTLQHSATHFHCNSMLIYFGNSKQNSALHLHKCASYMTQCCRVLQCVAVCCSAPHIWHHTLHAHTGIHHILKVLHIMLQAAVCSCTTRSSPSRRTCTARSCVPYLQPPSCQS